MSLKMIKPLDITDSIMTSSVAEPDPLVGEAEWVDRTTFSTIQGDESGYSTMIEVNGILYTINGTEVKAINPLDDSVTVVETGVGSYAQRSGQALGDSIYYVGSTGAVHKFDTLTLTSSEFGTYSDDSYYATAKGSDTLDRYIYAVGAGSQVLLIDTTTESVTEFGSHLGGYRDMARANNGNIYCVGSSGKVLEIDTQQDTASEFGDYEGSYRSISKHSSGELYCIGFTGVVMIINPTDKSIRFTSSYSRGYTRSLIVGDDIYSSRYGGYMRFNINSNECLEYSNLFIERSPGDMAEYESSIYCAGFTSGDSAFIYKLITAYNEGDRVIETSTHKLYEAATTTTDDPEIGVDSVPPTWVEVSATNKYRAFDYTINTKSQMESATAELTFTPLSPVTNIALFGLEYVKEVFVNVYEDDINGMLIYTGSKTLAISSPIEDIIVNDELLGSKVLFDDLPTYATPHIVVTFDSDEDEILVGDVVIGNARTLGVTLYQSSTSRTSYDTVETDTFGNESVVSRPSAEYTSFEVTVYPQYADYVERILKDSLNKPRVWAAEKPDGESLVTFGYYERSPITYSSPSKYDTTLKVRGLV